MIIQLKNQASASYATYVPIALVFALGFLAAYTFCLLSPLREAVIAELQPGEELTEATLNFQWKFAGIGVMVGSVTALAYFLIRRNKKFIFKIIFNEEDQQLELFFKTTFSNRQSQIFTIAYEDLLVELGKKGKRLSIVFYEQTDYRGEIRNDEGLWENEPIKFRQIIALLRDICPRIHEKKSN